MKTFCGFLPWFLMATVLWGQDQTPRPGALPPQSAAAPQTQPPANSADRTVAPAHAAKSKPPQKKRSDDRLFYALPNNLTVENAANASPLTVWQKFKLTAQDSFDPVEFVFYGALAGLAQAENDDPTFGQGAKGYARRYAQRFGDGTIENFMAHPIFGTLFHEDPRYFQLGKGGFWHRTAYALSRVLITRTDSGGEQFNYSEILGSAAAAGISTYTYHPQDERNLLNAASVWGSQMGWDALGFVTKEFWPDIRRKLHNRRTPAGP